MSKLFSYDFDRAIQASREVYTLPVGVLARELLSRKLLIIDIEATGLDILRDEITEIAVQQYDPALARKGEGWRSYIRISGEIPAEISRLTSITRADTDSGMPVEKALSYLVRNYADHIWVAQCGFEFDFPFLARVFTEASLPPAHIDTVDPKVIFSLLHPELHETFSTNFLAEYFGIDRTSFARHTAAGDVALITEIVAALVQEARSQGLNDVEIARPITVRKFIPQPLS